MRGQQARLPGDEAALDRLPRKGASASFPRFLLAVAHLDALLHGRVRSRR
nr:hypothetical protein [Microbacterium testaceum]